MTNYPFEEIEQKEFNLKFSFEMLTSTIMFIQKVKNLELNALNTIYRSMKWAETNNEPELAVKYANLYITNKKRLKK